MEMPDLQSNSTPSLRAERVLISVPNTDLLAPESGEHSSIQCLCLYRIEMLLVAEDFLGCALMKRLKSVCACVLRALLAKMLPLPLVPKQCRCARKK